MSFLRERGIGVGRIDPSEPEVGYSERLRFNLHRPHLEIRGIGGGEDRWVPISIVGALREFIDRFKAEEGGVVE